MARRTPPIGCVGRYELVQPWVASTAKVYTCKAIRTFQDLRVKNIDPYTYAYKPYGAEKTLVDNDEREGACIVTLIADDGETIYVPDTQIVSYPNMGDYHYRRAILSIDLGAIPDNLSLDWLIAKIKEETTGIVGIDPQVKLHESEIRDAMTPEAHERAEAARAAARQNQVTTKAQLEIAKTQLSDLTLRYRELEKYVTDNDLLT